MSSWSLARAVLKKTLPKVTKHSLGLGLVFTLLASGAASARPTGLLTGEVAPSGLVEVRLSEAEIHGTEVRGFRVSFRDIPLTCSQGSSATTNFRAPLVVVPRSAHRFATEVTTLGDGGEQPSWAYQGRLGRHGAARGTVRFRDRRHDLGDGQTDDCSSGVLRWSARPQA
jgi:hypothetical protein